MLKINNAISLLVFIFSSSCYVSSAQNLGLRADLVRIDTCFLYENNVTLSMDASSGVILRKPAFILNTNNVNLFSYKNGLYVIFYEYPSVGRWNAYRTDVTSVDSFYKSCWVHLFGASYRSEDLSEKLANFPDVVYHRIHISMECVYIGRHRIPVPKFKSMDKQKKYHYKMIKIYVIIKIINFDFDINCL